MTVTFTLGGRGGWITRPGDQDHRPAHAPEQLRAEPQDRHGLRDGEAAQGKDDDRQGKRGTHQLLIQA